VQKKEGDQQKPPLIGAAWRMTGYVEIKLIVMVSQTKSESVKGTVMYFVGLDEGAMSCDGLQSARLFRSPLCSYLLLWGFPLIS